MKRLFFSLLTIIFAFHLLFSQNIKDEIKSNIYLSGGNYLAYPDIQNVKYTPSPAGYVPFHIEHYGRHGSRWLIDAKQYSQPVETLEKADKYGYLTAKGKETLSKLRILKNSSNNRLGELTELGAIQHRNIARRMFRNFPEVFSDSTEINARSTVVIRCILSMENECQELKALNPSLRINHDASQADMYYMNYYDDEIHRTHDKARAIYKEITAKGIPYKRFISQLINNQVFLSDSIDSRKFMDNMFDIASNMQSHNFDFNFYDLFTFDELFAYWEQWNKFWYLGYGNSAQLEGKLPFIQQNLLNNIITSADKAIATGKNGASLRFGHEICVLPLACLMELNDCNKRVNDLNQLAEEWQAHDIFPMASNIQIIFYRNNDDNEILVKVLLNEAEASLPIQSSTAPYYKWNDLRKFYLTKLSTH